MLTWVMRHQPLTLVVTILTSCAERLSVHQVPRDSSRSRTPAGDGLGAGRPGHFFRRHEAKMEQFVEIVMQDPAVETIVGFAGAIPQRTRGACSLR